MDKNKHLWWKMADLVALNAIFSVPDMLNALADGSNMDSDNVYVQMFLGWPMDSSSQVVLFSHVHLTIKCGLCV